MQRRSLLKGAASLALATLLPNPTFAAAVNSTATASFDDLGMRVLARLDKTENQFISPYSLARALAMAGLGAQGQTEREFLRLLGFADQQALIRAYSKAVPQTSQVTLREANSFWFDTTFKVRQAYGQRLKSAFRAQFYETNFRGDPKGSADKVNDWASRETEGKIKKVLKPNPALRCLLANAVYFKGDWDQQFKVEATQNRDFHTPKGLVKVPTMHQLGSLGYARFGTAQAVRLPYKGKDTAMTVYLPGQDSDLTTLEKKVKLGDWRTRIGSSQVKLSLPKFKLETGYELKDTLMGLGLRTAFTKSAQFAPISQEPLKIDHVNQKAYVEVDEEGTEAAAVTTIGMVRTTSVPRPPLEVKVDRPFLFTIEHLPTQTLLFLGRVVDPS